MDSQTAPATVAAVPVAVDPAALPGTSYRLGLEDEIRLVVVGEDQLTNTFRIQSDGGITLPLIGTVPAQGLTTIELQERIRAALAKDYFRNPQVRVEVSRYGSQFVIVQGEVRAPQKVAMTGPMTLNEALAAAGSWTPNASSVVNIARKRPQRDAENIHVNLDDLSRGIAGADIPLVGGDIITVPKAETIFVQGQVKTVGVYNWEPGLTVNQAITKAGGISDKGRDSGIKITRTVDGRNKEIDVKLTDLVQPNDIIVVAQRRF
jgi:polysaccharide export outer membrane protein